MTAERQQPRRVSPGGGAEPESTPPPSSAAASEAVRDALQAPQPLDKERLAEIVSRPLYLGRPSSARSFEQSPADIMRRAETDGARVSEEMRLLVARDETRRAIERAGRKRAPGGGRPSKKTQYDTWAERRRDLHRRLVRLPSQAAHAAKSAGDVHSARTASLHDLIVSIARRLARECTSMAELAREVRKAPELGHKAAKRGPTAPAAAINPFAALLASGQAAQLEAVGLAPRLSIPQIQRILTNARVKPGHK